MMRGRIKTGDTWISFGPQCKTSWAASSSHHWTNKSIFLTDGEGVREGGREGGREGVREGEREGRANKGRGVLRVNC